MWLWYNPHGFVSHICFKHIYIQKPQIEHKYLPHASAFGNYVVLKGSVSHINGVKPSFLEITAYSRKVSHAHDMHM